MLILYKIKSAKAYILLNSEETLSDLGWKLVRFVLYAGHRLVCSPSLNFSLGIN